jgi:cytochrome c biogenesis protein CcdA/thiol-disulfide isomerase/thioredoxin
MDAKNAKVGLGLVAIFLVVLISIFGVYAASTSANESCSVETTNSCNLGVNFSNSNVVVFGQNNNSTNSTNESICVYFFYGTGCPHCAKIEPLIEELAVKYPRVELKSYEIYFNKTNQDSFLDFVKRYGIENEGIPAVFIGDRAYIGETAIRDNLESSINYFMTHEAICPEKYVRVEGGDFDNTKLTLTTIISAAVIDSINPCAFSVLIFLLVYLMALGSKKKVLKIGLTYIFAVFVVYFLSGLGLFVVIQQANITKSVYLIAAIVAIGAGLINVKDFFWYGKGITLAIPESGKSTIEKYIHKASIPAAIILGILVSLFELPCTGGVYLAILGLLSTKMTLWQGIPYLLLYNIIFVLPLFIILGIVYKGTSPESLEKWRSGNRKWLRLIMGLGMILLGVAMLAGWI